MFINQNIIGFLGTDSLLNYWGDYSFLEHTFRTREFEMVDISFYCHF